MPVEKMAFDPKKMEPGGTAGSSEAPVQVKVVQLPAKCLGSTAVQPSAAAEAAPKLEHPLTKVVPAVRSQQPASSTTVSLSGLQTPPSVVVITKVAAQGGAPGTSRQPPLRKAVLSQVAPLYQGQSPVRTVMITVPAAAPTHKAAVSHALPVPTSQSPQLPANIHIPPGEQKPSLRPFHLYWELFLDQGIFTCLHTRWTLTSVFAPK